MPLPNLAKREEYLRKGIELLLRQVGLAPEMRAARRLAPSPSAAPTSPTSPTILIVTPRDWAAHVQYEAVIGRALALRGADVHHLTCGGGLEICDRANVYEAPPMPCRTCTRYVHSALDAHGANRTSMAEAWGDGAWSELDATPASELGDVTLGGLPLGEIVDIPLKWFLCAADLGDEPLAGHYHRRFLRSARRIAEGVEAALDRIQPDVVLLLNGLFLFEGVAWALAARRGIDVVTYERAFLRETLVFSRGVPAGYYDFGTEWDPERPLTDAESSQLDEYLRQRRSGQAFDQFWEFASTPEERGSGTGRLAVLFTNLTWDTAVIGREAGFRDIRAWLDAAISTFEARPQDQLVIRVHPSELRLPGKRTRDSLGDYISQRFGDLPPNVTVVGADDQRSSYALMDACDVGLVYSSTTGLELALSGKPVIVGAQVHYRGKGFTNDVGSAEELSAAIDRCFRDDDEMEPDRELARRYAHFFFFRAPIPAPGVREPLPGLAHLTIDRLEDLAPGADPGLDRICEGILGGHAFVQRS